MNYQRRREKLMNFLEKEGIKNILIQNLDNIFYFSGFNAAVTSRPFALMITRQKNVLIVPMVAADSAKAEAPNLDISVYCEHPEGAEEGLSFSFYANLSKVLAAGTQGKNIGVEAGRMSLLDQKLLNGLGFEVQDISAPLSLMRSIKEAEELAAVRLSGQYADFMIKKTLAVIRPGITEIEIDQAGAFALNQEVARNLPRANVSSFIMSTSGVERTAMPHSNSSMRQVRPGDAVILCRQIGINGYRAQCDRIGFLGQPTKEQAAYYSLVLSAHATALEAIRPGTAACQIDKAIRDVYQKAGVAKYFIHRSGSGIGISIAEAPYLRFDSQDILDANMSLVIQPALYIPGIGGFRCTDTVIVREGGNELVTHYPKDIKSLTL